MAFTLDTKRKQRFDFMRCLYEKTEGSEVGLVYIEEVAEEIGLAELETEIIALYLVDEGLIRIRMQHIISITHIGIDEVETVLGRPDRATAHFPALQTVPYHQESDNPQSDVGPYRRESNLRRGRDRSWEKDFAIPSPEPVNKAGDDLAAIELKSICEAIGLDPREITGEAAPGGATPAGMHHPGNEASDDVRRLIERAEAACAPSSAPRPSAGEAGEAESRPVTRPPARSQEPANRETAFSSRESDVADVLASLKLRLIKVRLAPDDMGEAQAEIATAIAQLLSPRPKALTIALSLETLLCILEKAGPVALTDDIEASLRRLRAFLQPF